jgi:hypothetical protein
MVEDLLLESAIIDDSKRCLGLLVAIMKSGMHHGVDFETFPVH